MTQMVQFIAVLLAAFGMVSVGWLVLGALVLPGGCAGRIVIDARGDVEGLEQAVKAAIADYYKRKGVPFDHPCDGCCEDGCCGHDHGRGEE